MSWMFVGILAVSVLCAALTGQGPALAAAVPQGAQAGVTLAVSLAGSLCLWAGVGKLMEAAGVTGALARLLRPVLGKLFPSAKGDAALSGAISGNICANFLGLGNAATPMGIQAARRLAAVRGDGAASDELCRLIVMNTASIQLLPTTVAAVRVSQGCGSPFDILPAVWITSICSVGMGLAAAAALGKLWRHG